MNGPEIKAALKAAAGRRDKKQDKVDAEYYSEFHLIREQCVHEWEYDDDDYHSAKEWYSCKWCGMHNLVQMKRDLPVKGRGY